MKSKIKKLITIALATTMLLGMTLTVNAATKPRCPECHLNNHVILLEYTYEFGQTINVWYCGDCAYAWRLRQP